MNISILLRKAECVKDGTVAGISVFSDGLMPNYKLELFHDSASAKYVAEEVQKQLFKIIECRADFELKLRELPKDSLFWIIGSRGNGKTPPQFHGPTSFNIDDPQYQEDYEEKNDYEQ